MEFLRQLFSSNGYMPHGHCYLWNPQLVFLHVISDSLTALAYTSIPFTLLYFVRRRKDVPFNWMFLCFGAFIVACGATHAMEIWTLWTPTYWLSGCVKAITAIASVATAILLVRLVPRALAIPSAAELAQAHSELRQAHAVLERRVQERTAELTERNKELAREIAERKRAEAAVRVSEARKTAVMEAALDAIVVIDHEGRLIEFNAAAEKMFGHRRTDVVGALLADVIIPPARRDRQNAGLSPYLSRGEPTPIGRRIEVEAVRADGSQFPAEVAIVRIPSEGDAMFTGYIRDISERRQAAMALQLSEQRFRRLSESGIVGVVISDSNGVARESNDTYLSILGYTRADLEAGVIRSDTIHLPEWAAEHEAARKQLLATGTIWPWETEFQRKDGTRVPVLVAVTAIDPPHVLSIVLDLTAQKRAEEVLLSLRELREADALVRALLEAAPDAMVIVDQNGQVVLINAQAERMFGYPRAELVGQSVERLVPERYHGVHAGHRHGYFGDPKLRAMGAGLDLFARRKDGVEFPVEVSLSPLSTKDGLLVSGAIRDISERRRAEIELRRAKEAAESAIGELEAFSYSVAHDLRAPLRAINGFSMALTEDFGTALGPQANSYLERISAGATRMGELIDALLSLSRVSRTDPAFVPVKIGSIAEGIAGQLRAAEPGRATDFVIDGSLMAEGDPSLLRALLENLLGNAWKFSAKRDRGRIEFGRTEKEGVKAFFVRDNGAGFDMKYAGKLFAPFQRLHAVTEFPGTGIGLATVERIVRRHSGRVWAESVVGQGATFYFTLQDPREAAT